MIYKQRPGFRVRPLAEIKADLQEARRIYGSAVRTLFLPDGNTVAMPTDRLCDICRCARQIFPELRRITVYGSAQYIHQKGLDELRRLAQAGLGRIHVGLESGDDIILRRIRKGSRSDQQIEAGRWVMQAGIELSLYVILGIGGRERTRPHATETARVLNAIGPDFIRLRTFVPKVNTPLLDEVRAGTFQMLGPHDVLRETAALLEKLDVAALVASDHYTNYINLEGRLPRDKPSMLAQIAKALERDEKHFRPFFIGVA
jgi:radical SAM superfamily enzyme YgiQ (UPF0313 family)